MPHEQKCTTKQEIGVLRRDQTYQRPAGNVNENSRAGQYRLKNSVDEKDPDSDHDQDKAAADFGSGPEPPGVADYPAQM